MKVPSKMSDRLVCDRDIGTQIADLAAQLAK